MIVRVNGSAPHLLRYRAGRRTALERATKVGAFLGAEPERFPRDFAVLGGAHRELAQIRRTYPFPTPLTWAAVADSLGSHAAVDLVTRARSTAPAAGWRAPERRDTMGRRSDSDASEHEETRHKEPVGDNRQPADRRPALGGSAIDLDPDFAEEHAPSETDPAAWSPRWSVRDNRPEWPTRA
ncbi:hypothetical protein F4561_002749 [Lipingzhangella halophila]|uniref:Uncharacterized protein n=1 Tax=Lipingzhangella halophila TaxID=1783352 RepID=A0A7W7RH77_9ACTN|nr:hypothetical protein [Lipingzhangella halophila]MBB4931929.1 hypothetical protein [Lipingzhangella halophila]